MAGKTAALRRGDEVRRDRARLRHAVKDDRPLALRILEGREREWEAVARQMPIERLLMLIPGVGPQTVDQLLDARGIPPRTRAFGLTIERRRELASTIRKEER